ncbi:transporter substrate-binding domain-containing protein [Salipiger sp. P9]|uniref:transporter substrate-binding domain-containing protein n=1 Tax=Salipiger pentaromativorans TaxID=2943193 RepID=UPI0021589346|nr:transporter substrate-binding domain-containing protein [Salipiger pentaromativorans]MCR8549278.1 transporter substrate-binding domain-containing protein [Salipiger pentaromativorans]
MKSTDAPVTLGFLFSDTGATSVIERAQRLAATLAIEEINQNGGILGREVRIAGRDPGSDPVRFRAEARRLLTEEHVEALFGCYMSSTRKPVLREVEAHRSMLFYPTHYEGFEYAPGCIYSGAAPNQNARWLADYMTETYGHRYFFVGSNYVFPYELNRIMRDLLSNRNAEVVDEVYIPVDPTDEDIDRVISRIQERTRDSGPVIIFSTIVGRGAVMFYQAYHRAGFDRSVCPIGSVTTGEPEMKVIGKEASIGNVKAAPYFKVIKSEANARFVSAYLDRYGPDIPLCAESEAAYFQVKLFAEAVRRVQSFDRDELISVLPTFSLEAPQGPVRVDEITHHTSLWPRVAVVREDGEFEIVREAPAPVAPAPYLVELDDPIVVSAGQLRGSTL